jgi:hypothetical protein
MSLGCSGHTLRIVADGDAAETPDAAQDASPDAGASDAPQDTALPGDATSDALQDAATPDDSASDAPETGSVAESGDSASDAEQDASSETSVAWSPATLPGLVLWLDGATGLTPGDGEGGTTLVWRDRSALSNDATAFGAPVVDGNALAGRPAVRLNGKADYFVVQDHPSLEFSTGDFAIALVTAHTTPVGGSLWGYGLFYSKQQDSPPFVGPALVANTPSRTGALQGQVALNTPSLLVTSEMDFNQGQPLYIVMRRLAVGAGNAALSLRVNGVDAVAGMGPGYSLDVSAFGYPLRIGGSGRQQDVTGVLAEVLAVKGTLSDADLARLDAYVKAKYGI